jgi:excisionase family DNA binding protein
MPSAQTPHIEVECVGKAEAATALGISLRSIDRLIASGDLPSVRLGGRRLIRLETLRRIAAELEST